MYCLIITVRSIEKYHLAFYRLIRVYLIKTMIHSINRVKLNSIDNKNMHRIIWVSI
nr:hypothetical protein [uncultured bacterium]